MANTISLRSLLEKEKLNGINFLDWFRNLRIVLKQERKEYVIEEHVPDEPAANAPRADKDKFKKHMNDMVDVGCLMLATMDSELQKQHENMMTEGTPVGAHVIKMMGYVQTLEKLGFPLKNELATDLILQSLPGSFKSFVLNFNMNEINKTLPQLLGMLRTAESDMKKDGSKSILLVREAKGNGKKVAKSKGSSKTKAKGKNVLKPKGPISKDGKCFHCNKSGHWKRNCPVYLEEVKKAKAVGASVSGIYVIDVNMSTSSSWVLDTGCGSHICTSVQGLHMRRNLAKGDVDLRVGNGARVAALAVGTYVLSLPRKMTKAPFNGKGERASDLLGLIHSDVCGPMNTQARAGFHYFNTFTDDFSRYGYIYLMRHKSEALEKFKEFRNEVQNQHGKSIKALRSDRGGEYLSHEFDELLKGCGIVSQLTPPGTPQWNGVFERRNRTLLDMVRSMMSHSHLPISFWGHALETTAFTLNRVPSKSVQKTPHEMWTGKRPKVERFSQTVEENSTDLKTRPLRRSTRERHEPERYGFLVTTHGDVILVDHDEPKTYQEAVSSPDSEKWLEAMRSEMDSMSDNQVWTFVEPPEGIKPIGCKWVFKKKTDMDGNVQTYKGRLVAKGYRQIHGIDYDETFSPIAMFKSIRILLAIAAFHDYEIWQMDVKIAFLNGKLEEDVYMTQPEGFVTPENAGKVCKLQRSIYGLKQASRSWNLRFNDAIKEFSFIRNEDEPCVYKKFSGSIVPFLILTKDAFLVYGGEEQLSIKGYTDASFQTDKDDSRSQSGFVFRLNGGAVSWKSSKQDTVADSTTEAEYIAASEAAKEAVWIKKFITELGVVPSISDALELYYDNNGAIAQAKEPRSHQRSKHILRRFHLIRESVDRGDVKICTVHMDDNIADPLTKPLSQ
ncbi:hypothetical protein V6N13_037347 [Hibiscus sabdariffa]